MDTMKRVLAALGERLEGAARSNAVVGDAISVGDRHVIPLCQLSLAIGGGVGGGAGTSSEQSATGGGAGGGAKATPVAVIVVEGGKARVETLGQ